MNTKLLHTDVQEFIVKHSTVDIPTLLLKKPFFNKVSNRELAQQILGRRKAEKKLPTWHGTPQIYFPEKLHLEQASSEVAARYKAQLVNGARLMDLTGGMGVDSYFFSRALEQVHYCEINQDLAEITAHNFSVLGKKSIQCIQGDGVAALQDSRLGFDWLYVDPSRRNASNRRVFLLQDCIPNVPGQLPLFFAKAGNVLLKTSPLLDIAQGLKELHSVGEIHVVAIGNEVKELLWVLKKAHEGPILVKTVNFGASKTDIFSFSWGAEKKAVPHYAMPQKYLYEPNAAILKSGAFTLVGEKHGVFKLHEHSHLYTSEDLMGFPGRRFRIVGAVDYSKTNVKRLQIKKAQVATRNFPEKVASIRKRFQIADGGETYLFFTKNKEGRNVVLQGTKIKE